MSNDLLDKIAGTIGARRIAVHAVAYDETGAPSEIGIAVSCDRSRSLVSSEIAALMRAGIYPTETGWRALTPAEQRDAFCLDAARKTIDDVRQLVKAGPLEATTDAVARALRKEGGEDGEVAIVIRVPLDATWASREELAEMTDDEILGVFLEDTSGALDPSRMRVERGKKGSEG